MFFLQETHCSGNRASILAGRMGFQQSFIIDASGHSGGIWCLWDPSCWTVRVLCSDTRYVHMEVRWKNENSWYLTAVYANPRYQTRKLLWQSLEDIAEGMNDPWAIIGDFNSTLSDQDRIGGSQNPSQRGCNDFKNMVKNCELVDAGFQGPPFTWQRGNLCV